MTTHHQVDLSLIGICGDSPEERAEQDRILIRNSATAARDANAAVFIYEKVRFWHDDDEDGQPIAAIIPASLAKDLIREGRLGGPPVASMTVLARDLEPITDVPMVCTSCRKPVERTFDDEWQHQDLDDGLACSARERGPVKAMAAAGQENVPNRSEEK